MPGNAVTITATYKLKKTSPLTVVNGAGGGEYYAGQEVEITMNTVPEGKVFTGWTTLVGGYAIENPMDTTITVTMMDRPMTFTANFVDTYQVTVVGGNGSGLYPAGATVDIEAPAVSGKRFIGWIIDGDDIVLGGDDAEATNSFTMPARTVTITANYNDLANKDALSARIDELASVTRPDSASDGLWEAFEKAQAEAGLVLSDIDATQAQVDAALRTLNAAYAALTASSSITTKNAPDLLWLWILLGVIGLLGAGVCVYFFVFKKKKKA
jgi:hypothetical protein